MLQPPYIRELYLVKCPTDQNSLKSHDMLKESKCDNGFLKKTYKNTILTKMAYQI